MSFVSLVSLRMLVRVRRWSGGKAASPMMRFGQKFTTSISSWFAPGFTASLMSTRNGGDQVTPQDWPLTFTSASSRTLPRSSQSAATAEADRHRRQFKSLPIDGRAGVELDARLGTRGPAHQVRELDRSRPAPARIEGHLPRAGQFG